MTLKYDLERTLNRPYGSCALYTVLWRWTLVSSLLNSYNKWRTYGQAVLSNLTLNCLTLSLAAWCLFIAHRLVSGRWRFVSSYIQFMQLRSYDLDKLFFNIWPWTVTLTLGVATWSLVITHRLMIVNIKFVSIYIKFLQLMKELWAGQAVFQHLTLNCDLDLGLFLVTSHRLMMVNICVIKIFLTFIINSCN